MALTRDEFVEQLEDVLDKHFPKGQATARGDALVLFSNAVVLAEQIGAWGAENSDEEFME